MHNDAAESPLRSLAGPSRVRTESRQARTSLSKPYARKSAGGLASYNEQGAADGSRRARDSLGGGAQHTPRRSNAATLNAGSPTIAVASPTPSGGGGGLFSGLREAIFSRPLSWLSRGASRSDVVSPSQARSNTSLRTDGANDKTPNRSGTTSDPSAFVAPTSSTPLRPSMDTQTPSRSSLNRSQYASRSVLRAHSPALSATSATAQILSHGRERMSVEPASPRIADAVRGTPGYMRGTSQRGGGGDSVSNLSHARSSASFAYGFGSERRLAGLGAGTLSHSPLHASTSYGRLPSRSPFAMQRRSLGTALSAHSVDYRGGGRSSIAGGELGGAYNVSPRVMDRSLGQITTPTRPISMFGGGGSRAGSLAGSRASSRNATPKRREWSSLNIAPPNANRSEGEELMREYLAMRDSDRSAVAGKIPSPSVVLPAVNEGFRAGNATNQSRGDEVSRDDDRMTTASHVTETGAVKRGASVDYDDAMSDVSQQPQRKRQMVWDTELGFVSRQEQRAKQPPKPVARNEAERLLNALEGMRTPLGDAYRDGNARSTTPSRNMIRVPVPMSSSSSTASRADFNAKAVSPYARAMRNSRLSASVEPEQPGLRSRLRRQNGQTATASVSSSRQDDEMSVSSRAAGSYDDELRSDDVQSESGRRTGDEMEVMIDEDEDEDDDEPEPPRRRSALAHRPQSNAKQSAGGNDAKETDSARTLRSGKVLQPTAERSPPKKVEAAKHLSSPSSKPMSKARIGISMGSSSAAPTNKQYADRKALFGAPAGETERSTATASAVGKGGGFSVRVDSPSSSSDSQPTRTRSSLRHGAEKTSRTHARSGRIGLDDEADEDNSMDDSPSNEELDKIKLPTNLFPKGFDFGSSAASSASSTPPPTDRPNATVPSHSGTEQVQDSTAPSLLSRLGGFAPGQETAKTQPDTVKAPPTFSFSSANSSTAAAPSTAKPTFAFQPSVSSPLAVSTASPSPQHSAATPPSFFTPPAEHATKANGDSSAPAEKRDKSVPNFFASSLAKSGAAAASGSDPAKAVEPAIAGSMPTFSFSKPAESKSPAAFSFGQATAPPSAERPSKEAEPAKPTFSFGQPSSTTASGSGSPSLFGKPDTSKAAGQTPAVLTPSFTGFGAAPAASVPPFSFGATSTTPSSASDAGQKRGADRDEGDSEPQQKKVSFGGFSGSSGTATTPAPSFSFGAGAAGADQSKQASSTTPSTGFSFGATKAGAGEKKSDAPTGFSFGGAGTTGNQTGSGADKPAFTFGAPSAAPQPAAKPSFSLGGGSAANSNAMDASSPPSSSTNAFPSFGAAPASSASAGQASNPAFSFGAPQSSSPSPLAVSSPTGSAPGASSTAFSFGGAANTSSKPGTPTINFGGGGGPQQQSSAPAFGSIGTANAFGSQDSSRQGSPAPFAFGQQQQQHQQSTTGFGGVATASAPNSSGFTFGSAANAPPPPPQQQQQQSGGFSFSMPMNTAAAAPSASFGSSGQVNANAGAGAGMGTPPPFVFGGGPAAANGGGGAGSAPSGGFQFGAQPTMGMAAGSGATTPTQQAPGSAGSLFNIGGPSSSPAGNRPVRGMPSRRKKA